MATSANIYMSASADHHLDPKQLRLKRAVIHELESQEFHVWRYFEEGSLRKGWGFEKSAETMDRADGAIALAFAQWECRAWVQDPPNRGSRPPKRITLSLESGLALANGVPLFVVREEGTQKRGILSPGPVHTLVTMPRGSDETWVTSGVSKTVSANGTRTLRIDERSGSSLVTAMLQTGRS